MRFNPRITAMILVLALCIAPLLACSSDEAASSTTANGDAPSTENAATTEQSIYDVLPKADFQGETFVIYNPPNPDSPVDKGTTAEEQISEPFNDAVYSRNQVLQEKYNVIIRTHNGANWDSTYGDLKKTVTAGLQEYDLVYTHVISNTATMITEGLLQPWQNIPHVDFTKPWWNQSCINSMQINGRSFYASGSMHLHDPLVLIENKNMVSALALENPYELVKNGDWTIDKLIEMCKAAVNDVNGDGKFDLDDQYGLEYGKTWQLPTLFYAAGMQSVTMNPDGTCKVNLNTPRMVEIYNKIYELLYGGNYTSLVAGNVPAEANHPHIGLQSGRVLFTQMNLFTCESLRNSEIDYGILPMPKYDKAQEKYYTNSWTGMLAVPSIIDDPKKLERIGIIIEAMAAEGYRNVIPVYYDVVLKEKYARDQDSRLMLDIILESIIYDIGLCFNDAGGPGMLTGQLMGAKKQNYVSEIEKQEPKIQATLDKVFTQINEKYPA